MKLRNMSRARRWALALLSVLIVLTVVFILNNASDNPEQTYEKSDGVVAILRNIIDPFGLLEDSTLSFLVRKAAHFSEYALLGAELYAAVLLLEKKSITAVPFAVLLTAVIDETIQIYAGRTSSTVDVLIDLCGGIAGILFTLLCALIASRIRKKRTEPAGRG